MAGLFVRPNPSPPAVPRCLPCTCDRLTRSQTIHYLYRALLAPLVLNPSMSPIHPTVWLSALAFQLVNSISIGGWLAGYGPTSPRDWQGRILWIQAGLMVWTAGFASNIYHDDELREIRRAAGRVQRQKQRDQDEKSERKGVDKVYMIPQNGLFRAILYPHYVSEWVEWCGYWMVAGLGCVPARNFVLAEVSTMLPRALQGRQWYLKRFGRERVDGRRAVIPGLL